MILGPQNVLTDGQFTDEAAAWAHFDSVASNHAAFHRVHREVWGDLIHPRPCLDDSKGNRLRIDRVLVPSQGLIAAGWKGGLIGVEGKRSGEKVGRLISQALDYSRCVFELPESGFLVMLRWVFLWPLEGEPTGDIGSVMSQNRLGWVRTSNRTPLVFGCGGTHGITLFQDNQFQVKPLPMGRKKGNRG